MEERQLPVPRYREMALLVSRAEKKKTSRHNLQINFLGTRSSFHVVVSRAELRDQGGLGSRRFS